MKWHLRHSDFTSNLMQSLANLRLTCNLFLPDISAFERPPRALSYHPLKFEVDLIDLNPLILDQRWPPPHFKLATLPISRLTSSMGFNFGPPGNVKSSHHNRSSPKRPYPMKSDQSSHFEVDFGNPKFLAIHADYIISSLRVVPMQCPLSQSEASDAHRLGFKLVSQTPDVMMCHANCPLLIGQSPHDWSGVRTPEFKFR